MKKKFLQIGKIGRPHGRFGEVRVHLFNDSASLLCQGIPIYLDEDGTESLSVVSARPATKCYLVQFEGYHYRDEAQILTNRSLWVDRDAMPPTDEDEFYCSDLLGFEVVAQNADLSTTSLGTVTGFLDNVETDVMIVEGPRIAKRWLVPFISSVVLSVSLQDQKITLAPLDEWTHDEQVLL